MEPTATPPASTEHYAQLLARMIEQVVFERLTRHLDEALGHPKAQNSLWTLLKVEPFDWLNLTRIDKRIGWDQVEVCATYYLTHREYSGYFRVCFTGAGAVSWELDRFKGDMAAWCRHMAAYAEQGGGA